MSNEITTTNTKGFGDLVFSDSGNFGIRATYEFDNNYGVSVIKSAGSYGGSQGLWEVAVLYANDITYNTPITDDVIGFLSEEEVTEIMHKVQALIE